MPASAHQSKGMEMAAKRELGWNGLRMVKPVSEDEITRRQQYLKLWQYMRLVRSSWLASWREIIEYVLPYLGRFVNSDTNQGQRKDQDIIDNTATQCVNAASAGLQSGLTSPARPWFRILQHLAMEETEDDDQVLEWMHSVEVVLERIFAQSNLYTSLEQVYLNLVGPGTACMFIEDDEEDILRFFSVPIGQFSLGTDHHGRVNRIIREARFTVIQTVERFGLEMCSPGVQNAYKEHLYDRYVDVLHVVEPNDDQLPGLATARGMPFRSAWLELASTDVSGIITAGDSAAIGLLKESGYREFPAVCPRWSATGEDAYGHSPSWDAIGDIKMLQLLWIDLADQVAKLGKPPLSVPDALRHQLISMLPGTTSYVPNTQANAKIEPIVQVLPEGVKATLETIGQVQQRIKATYLYNLWLAVTDDSRDQRATAAEINARRQEVMLQLGQVLTRFNDECLDPLFERVIPIIARRGLLPPAPPQLVGKKIRPEYVSVLAQAQKAVGTTAIERTVGFVVQLAQGSQDPSPLDNIDKDKVVRKYWDAIGVQPDLLLPPEQVAAKRQQRARQVQSQQLTEGLPKMAAAVKSAAGASLDGNNALTRILSAMGPLAASGTPGGPNEPPPTPV